jgi:hypothetical protein
VSRIIGVFEETTIVEMDFTEVHDLWVAITDRLDSWSSYPHALSETEQAAIQTLKGLKAKFQSHLFQMANLDC